MGKCGIKLYKKRNRNYDKRMKKKLLKWTYKFWFTFVVEEKHI